MLLQLLLLNGGQWARRAAVWRRACAHSTPNVAHAHFNLQALDFYHPG
jgi:hypothetical protein